MKGIRNIIARRRPSQINGPSPEAMEGGQSDAFCFVSPSEVPDEGGPFDLAQDLTSAQAARDHVPAPGRPVADQYPDWTRTQKEPARQDPADVPHRRQKIWDIEADAAQQQTGDHGPQAHHRPTTELKPMVTDTVAMEAPKAERPVSSRPKTRLLGFHGEAPVPDIFDQPTAGGPARDPQFPVGWIVVVDGPGRGASFTLTAGLSTVGRDPGQTVALDFGDASISREQHVAIAYDEEENRTFVGHGGKSNIVRLNDKPLLTTEDLNDGDTIRIGKTVLRYVAFCNDAFTWADPKAADAADG